MLLTKKSYQQQGNIRSVFSIIFSVLLVGAAVLLWTNKQYVSDWVAFQQFTPSAEISQIANRTTMTDQGKFYFYASKPQIENADEFNASCSQKEAGSAILGCYANNHIYVYAISNPQLDGIKEVTAAHEMLHAVYQRMGQSEKSQVNALLEKEYEKAKTDKDLAQRMSFYDKYEAGERDNELHSIIGTEFPNISSELEDHYKKYFSDRSQIVSLHDKYDSVFTSLKAKSDELLAKLQSLGPQIESESQTYNVAVKQLNNDIQAFNSKATNGGFTSQSTFTSERNRLIERSDTLDAQRQSINQDLASYESFRKEYNDTAASSNELYKSIDSKLAPAPSV